jgi:arabinogalactan oligomer/maltooligosaccharide transport system permease protein
MVTLLGGLQSIPTDLYEAASVDGTNAWQQFRYITLPLLQPVITTIVLLGTIWTFNSFNIIFLLTQGQPAGQTEILATYAYRLAFENYKFGVSAAYSVIILAILLIFSAVYARVINRNAQAV